MVMVIAKLLLAKRLAAYLNALRPLRLHILQRYLHRSNRYLLAR
jgi:hypothetical protein